MEIKYFLDPTVISILFRLENPKSSEKVFLDLQGQLYTIVSETVADYLRTNSVSEEDISIAKKMLSTGSAGQFRGDHVSDLLKSQELTNRIKMVNDAFIGGVYEMGEKKLNEEEKKQLEEYLAARREMTQVNNKFFETSFEILLDYLDSEGQKNSSFASINLGGAMNQNNQPSEKN